MGVLPTAQPTYSAEPTGGESKTGMGLWIARQALRAMGGRIWIDDRDEWDEHRVAYGYPLEAATTIAVRSVSAWLVANDAPAGVTFCCFAARDAAVYERIIESFVRASR